LSKRRRGKSKGQSVLYGVLLMPVLLLILALAVDVGSLQLEKLRLHYALDLATLTGATAVDQNFYSSSGRLRLDPTAASTITRNYLGRNVSGLPDGPAPLALPDQAEIVIVNQVPGRDPFSGAQLDRPGVCARIRVYHRFSLLSLVGIRGTDISVTSDAEIRV
jgi:hypothetical protein